MLRQFILSKEDQAPQLFNWARYFNHVVLRRSVTYPDMLGPIFKMIGSKNLEAVDVGANVGVFTRYLSRHFKLTHAIEPVPHLARRLKSVAPDKVHVHQCALGAKNSEISIRTPLDAEGRRMDALTTAAAQNNFELFGHSGTIETKVNQYQMANLLHNSNKIGFIKIDVEGFEDQVLAGAEGIILKDRPLLLIEIGLVHNPNFRKTLKTIEDYGYSGFCVANDGLSAGVETSIEAQPQNLANVPSSGWYGQWDFLFIPAEKLSGFKRYMKTEATP